MTALTLEHFDTFFHELHATDPYPWQHRLAAKALEGQWPGAIDLPTGSGKTACIDIALFALASQASQSVTEWSAPRRIFFCVNRRVIVDEAYNRARRVAEAIWSAESSHAPDKPTLQKVAEALREIGGTASEKSLPPIDAVQMRSGVYRDNRWARSLTQPTIICTTLDQLGSRLLFRGYGVSPNAAPIQAALIAYDSLVLLDEAHISEPFRQTLGYVQDYLDADRWAEQGIGVQPMRVVPMTATPNAGMRSQGLVQLDSDDRETPQLQRRLSAQKTAELQTVNDIVKGALSSAKTLMDEHPAALAIMVNRVATAKEIYGKLCDLRDGSGSPKRKLSADTTIELVIGSMRPVDRDAQADRLRELVGPDRPEVSAQHSIVVATQCLEVGADYDFDALITECASVDALQQRFGRLNRQGRNDAEDNPLESSAVILMEKKAVKSEEAIQNAEQAKKEYKRHLDPIYGNALARTWNWLVAHAEDSVVDFGIDAFGGLWKAGNGQGIEMRQLLAPSASLNAPTMLPAYVDIWCQTSPKPVPQPDVSLFIHGPRSGEPDVQVCWRADLIADDQMHSRQWPEVVALLPPTSAECVRVPISRVRRWLRDHNDVTDNTADVLGAFSDESEVNGNGAKDRLPAATGVLWRGGDKSKLLVDLRDLKPGDTLVLPARATASRVLGQVPVNQTLDSENELSVDAGKPFITDVAEVAFLQARDKAALRVHPSLMGGWPNNENTRALRDAAARREERPTQAEWRTWLQDATGTLAEMFPEQRESLQQLASSSLRINAYPDKRGVVLTMRKRLGSGKTWFIRAMDEGDDTSSLTQRDTPVMLADHSRHVRDAARTSLEHLSIEGLAQTIATASYLHDWGKADERFQAMLRCSDRTDAWLFAGSNAMPWAKSAGVATTYEQYKDACQRADLPLGFRHEMLSVQLAEQSGLLPDAPEMRELLRHLIAAHHGRARPFAPVVPDEQLPSVSFEDASLTHEERNDLVPPHRLDSGIAERFWTLTRRYGWWGLAYLEAVLRLADQQASAAEDAGEYAHGDAQTMTAEVTP